MSDQPLLNVLNPDYNDPMISQEQMLPNDENIIGNYYITPPQSKEFVSFYDDYKELVPQVNNSNELIASYPKDGFSQLILDHIIADFIDSLDVLKYIRDYYKQIYSTLKVQIEKSDKFVIKNLEKNNVSLAKKQKILQDQINKLNK